MRRPALVLVFTLALAGTAGAQVTTGGAGNTGIEMPSAPRATRPDVGPGPGPAVTGTTATPSAMPVPGTTPGVAIGGTPTSGPPGTGGTAGGPSLDNR